MNTFFTSLILCISLFLSTLTYPSIMSQPNDNHVMPRHKSETVVFSITPNPTQGFISVQCQALQGKESYVAVSDISGKTVLERYLKEFPESGKISIDLSAFATGIYIVRVQAGKMSLATKVVRI